jgi:tetratricopeptide (TPR) repeat protein
MNVSFHLDGRFHLLQIGPQPFGHCHGATRVHGSGTSSGTIYRASETKWVIDLPAGSVARLFDLSHTTLNAVDKGLYYVRLHYEIHAVPGAVAVLGPVAEAQGGAAVVARYRALKRDSAQAYFFDAGQLSPPAFWLLSNKKFNDAVIVFRLIVEEYPDAWNSYGGLGESYLALGDTSMAIASYRRSLELNPKNQNAADVLKRLGVKR